MMELEKIKKVWLVGIGGIGMSALARYFHLKGHLVAGYDRDQSSITDALEQEGVPVVFNEDPALIEPVFHDPAHTLVIYTPAIEKTHLQLTWFKNNGYVVKKRSEVLGLLTANSMAVCVAGTHGKTTISTMTAHLFRQSKIGCTAFLGGISRNYDTNFLWSSSSPFTVVEADEYDRSFLNLRPHAALVSAVDPDHLDIYGNPYTVVEAYKEFSGKVSPNGYLVVKSAIDITWPVAKGVKTYTYSACPGADFHADEITFEQGEYSFTLVAPGGVRVPGLKCGIPGYLNVENAVAASALALINGVEPGEIQTALPLFKGIARRFDVKINTPAITYIDDYAHHPEEIKATLESVRAMYPGRHLTGVFQPHLYSRTRDFAEGFARALEILDEVILLEIYPAREVPIPGVTSRIIANLVKRVPVYLSDKNNFISLIKNQPPQVVITMGAGDIDRKVEAVTNHLLALTRESRC